MIHFIERSGARVVRAGSVPCARSVPQPRDGEALEIVATPPVLPAFWRDGAAHPLPPQPTRAHKFSFDTLAWVPDVDLAWTQVRAERDARLAASDWVRLRAADLGEPVPPKWLQYRQALRDVTQQADPLNIEWPTPPT